MFKIFPVIIVSIIITIEAKKSEEPLPSSCSIAIYWVDRRCEESRDKDAAIDTLFDRAVGIILTEANMTRISTGKKVRNRDSSIATGVFITRNLVLSSYNAFMTLSQRNDTFHRVGVLIILSRRFQPPGKIQYYNVRPKPSILCARQVIPRNFFPPQPEHMRHGIHSPLHDLLVLKIDLNETFEPLPPRRFHFNEWKEESVYDPSKNNYNWRKMGPLRTILARPGDELGDDIRWASLGHLDERHIRLFRFLELGKISVGEKVITDCDGWIPREWGHFICLFNKHNYPGLGSGGLLFSDYTLFGIGSFALYKGKHSVLVFTDVRPYWHLLHRVCTNDDQNLNVPRIRKIPVKEKSQEH